ncbi:hypothetical protein DFR70_11426 [Nocardia tenerifensis]|uniref:Uncharacterized protein n=1 Tax=Nocardia tenerifensis TaxID=228006 RepID=A0A318JT27_9NOCA|nr:hypothetical protein [Nocardia tenerifensis]PXX58344.1 hypothetical protein DFR70_11426 [Nocardia tenerifensis]
MPTIKVNNTSDKTLVLFVEPWAHEYRMRPQEGFTLEFDDSSRTASSHNDFELSWHDQGVVVWTAFDLEVVVRDQSGTRLEPGHQHPPTG